MSEIIGQAPLFRSILFRGPHERVHSEGRKAPEYFSDLNLDQVVASIVKGMEEYDLDAFFWERLDDSADIRYRLEVFDDLRAGQLRGSLASFAEGMRQMRLDLGGPRSRWHRLERQGRFVDAVEAYCDSVDCLTRDLAAAEIRSEGLLALLEYLRDHVGSPGFRSMVTETREVKQALAGITYCVRIKGLRVTVSRYASEADQSLGVERTFEKFKQNATKDYRVQYPASMGVGHIQGAILDRLALLFPDVFGVLNDYCARHAGYLDDVIREFDREVQFYVAYLDYIEQYVSAGLAFCNPDVSRDTKAVHARDAFDLALANKLVPEGSPIVCNDFHLDGPERIIVVTGPNQGGKTTFARMFGQLHHLAGIGCPVPGMAARLFLFDELFTHFERQEDLSNRMGQLEDDLVRIRSALGRATGSSIVIMNEIFTSTTLSDARFLGQKVLEKVIELDLLCVYVTFVDELTTMGESTASMVSTVMPGHPTERTYKIERRPADGLAYAIAMAEHYGLSHERLRERVDR